MKKKKKRLQILGGVQDFYSFPEQRIKGVTLSSTNCFSSLLTLELHKAVCFYKRSLTVKGGKHRAPSLLSAALTAELGSMEKSSRTRPSAGEILL